MRNIEKIISPTSFTWVGDAFYTTSFIGGEIPRHRMDPFFAFGYNPDKAFSGASTPRGVGAHPHKGFETVTLAYKGQVEHRDSRGNHGIISEGDVQWMTAGAGIMHQEYHETEWAKKRWSISDGSNVGKPPCQRQGNHTRLSKSDVPKHAKSAC
jgi:redox-sensitive bicupin YhaK (pirin superfamily)